MLVGVAWRVTSQAILPSGVPRSRLGRVACGPGLAVGAPGTQPGHIPGLWSRGARTDALKTGWEAGVLSPGLAGGCCVQCFGR